LIFEVAFGNGGFDYAQPPSTSLNHRFGESLLYGFVMKIS